MSAISMMNKQPNTVPGKTLGRGGAAAQISVLSALTIFLGIMFIHWTAVPYGRMYSFFAKVRPALAADPSLLTDPNDPVYRESFVQLSVRMSLVELLNNEYGNGEMTADSPLLPFAVHNFADEVARHPECLVNCYLDLGKAYDLLGSVEPSQAAESARLAEAAYKKGLELVPGDQAIIYAYSVSLANQGRVNDGLALLRQSMASDNAAVAETHYYYGLLLYRADPANADQALSELEYALDRGVTGDPATANLVYQKLLHYYYGRGDLAHFTTVVKRLSVMPQADTATYKRILDYIDANGTLPPISFNG